MTIITMSGLPSRPAQRRQDRAWHVLRVLVIGGATAASALTLLAVPTGSSNSLNLAVGDVTTVDIIAPHSISYISQIQTEAARGAAAAAVSDVYDPPDTRVTRQQVTRAQQILDFIGSVRSDPFASQDQKLADLSAATDLAVDAALGQRLLSLTDSEWTAVRAETISVIERVMSSRVTADRIEEARNQVSAVVSVSLTEAQAELVALLAKPFIAPNSFFNESATHAAGEAAREAVAPISQSFVQGQTVITRGRVVTAADIEAMAALGLLQPRRQWQEIGSDVLVILIASAIFAMHMRHATPGFFKSTRLMLFVGGSLILFLLAARLVVPERTVLPFLFPSATFAMLMGVALGPGPAATLAVIFAALVGAISGGRSDVTAYVAVAGITGALSIGRGERIDTFFTSGLIVGVASAATILAFRLTDPSADLIGIASLIGASFINGLISAAATLVGFFALGNVLETHTSLQLIELTRPNHPLLQFLLRQAPGSYQHSLQVANLAEQAGERIGADTVRIRVGAMFHDVGKALHPEYFVENQIDSQNPHDGLPPEVSAQAIIEHVLVGLKMAARHRLPKVIRDCIAEHHGTNLTFYQFQRAVVAAGGDESQVDKSRFRYPGPKPQSKETALLMLADGIEAKSRADRPRTEEEIEKIVRYIVDRSLAANQLDECDLTMHDLKLIRESLLETLKSFYHSRLAYPEEQLPAVTTEDPALKR